MALILIIIGGVAGWGSGRLYASAYGILAMAALLVAGMLIVLQPGVLGAVMRDPPAGLVLWLVSFLELAVPYTLFAWLKAKRIENRGK